MTEPREPSVQAVVAWRNSPICPMHMDAGGVPAIADCPECVRIGLVAAYAVDFPPNPSEPLWLELLSAANGAVFAPTERELTRGLDRLRDAVDALNPVAARVPEVAHTCAECGHSHGNGGYCSKRGCLCPHWHDAESSAPSPAPPAEPLTPQQREYLAGLPSPPLEEMKP